MADARAATTIHDMPVVRVVYSSGGPCVQYISNSGMAVGADLFAFI